MATEVASWNLKDALSDAERVDDVLSWVETEQPDVAAFQEALREGYTQHLARAVGELASLGYAASLVDYEDGDGRADRHMLMMIAKRERLAPVPYGSVRMAGRNALRMSLRDDQAGGTLVDVYGAHLDDRFASNRLCQARDLTRNRRVVDTVLLLDGNNVHRNTAMARALRLAKPIAHLLPTANPDPDVKPPKLKRIGSLAQRMTGMADGRALQYLQEDLGVNGFVDADPCHQPTMPSKRPFLQLDHIMHDRMMRVDDGSFRVYPHNDLSDHRAISARLLVAQQPIDA